MDREEFIKAITRRITDANAPHPVQLHTGTLIQMRRVMSELAPPDLRYAPDAGPGVLGRAWFAYKSGVPMDDLVTLYLLIATAGGNHGSDA